MCIRHWSPPQDRYPKMLCAKIPSLTAAQRCSTHRPAQFIVHHSSISAICRRRTRKPHVWRSLPVHQASAARRSSARGWLCPRSQTVAVISGFGIPDLCRSVASTRYLFCALGSSVGGYTVQCQFCRFMWLSRQCNSWAHAAQVESVNGHSFAYRFFVNQRRAGFDVGEYADMLEITWNHCFQPGCPVTTLTDIRKCFVPKGETWQLVTDRGG